MLVTELVVFGVLVLNRLFGVSRNDQSENVLFRVFFVFLVFWQTRRWPQCRQVVKIVSIWVILSDDRPDRSRHAIAIPTVEKLIIGTLTFQACLQYLHTPGY